MYPKNLIDEIIDWFRILFPEYFAFWNCKLCFTMLHVIPLSVALLVINYQFVVDNLGIIVICDIASICVLFLHENFRVARY